jgi:alanine racemase
MKKFLKLDKKQYQENYLALKKFYGISPGTCLKNNAYGLGTEEIAVLLDEVGCDRYFILGVDEGKNIRNVTKIPCEIYSLESIEPDNINDYIKYNITPTVASLEEINIYKEDLLKKTKFIIYFDTGLTGKGIFYNEVDKVLENIKDIPKENIYMALSHLGTAWRGDVDNEFSNKNSTKLQHSRFLEVKKKFEDNEYRSILYSLGNTDLCRLGKEYFFDIPRPGRGIHGLSLYAENFGIKQAFHIVGKITQLKIGRKGEKIGYGAFQTFEKDTNLAIVNVGKSIFLSVNFKFLDKVRYKDKEYPVKFAFLAYSVIDFGDDLPEYLDEVEFLYSTRFGIND